MKAGGHRAATSGVDVVLVLPSYTDFWAVFHAGRSHYSELLAAGAMARAGVGGAAVGILAVTSDYGHSY